MLTDWLIILFTDNLLSISEQVGFVKKWRGKALFLIKVEKFQRFCAV